MSNSNQPHTAGPGSILADRYGEDARQLAEIDGYFKLTNMLARGSCRSFKADPIDPELIQLLCAAAMASPTKSDLQQRDIVVLRDPLLQCKIIELMSEQSWIADAPCLLVFCGNNRRQRRLHELRGREFANDHLDAFFNAAVDAGVALSAFVTAAEALGLGCCPISAIRNAPQDVSDLLGLPAHVFPVAGLALGRPLDEESTLSPRLPLSATVHVDAYQEDDIDSVIEAYDERRNGFAPYTQQRAVHEFGASQNYGWSEDKARQYALPERREFGQFVRTRGFDLG
ncbi:MAG: nitroreductase family protein [Rhizobiaceae bacterium]